MKDEIHVWLRGGEASTPCLGDVAAFAAKKLSKDDLVLDAGCGNGQLLALLRDYGWDESCLCGCDIEPTHVELAKKRTGLGNIFVCDMASDSVENPGSERFSLIAAVNWLHNDWRAKYAINCERRDEKDPLMLDRVLGNVVGLLKLGGYFVCDYRDVLPLYLIKTSRDFYDDIIRRGFSLEKHVKDRREDGVMVDLWFFRLRHLSG